MTLVKSLYSMLLYFSINFHLNRMGNGNDDISSKEHFEHEKPLGFPIEIFTIFNFVQIFKFYLVTQSL